MPKKRNVMRTVMNNEDRGFVVCYTAQQTGHGRNAGVSTRKWRFIPGENKLPQEILDHIKNHRWGKGLFESKDGKPAALVVLPLARSTEPKREPDTPSPLIPDTNPGEGDGE